MRYGILGPTRAWRDDGSEISLGGPARRTLLALLLVRPGHPVPVDQLTEELYPAARSAGHALQSQVSRLRPDVAIELVAGGYRLAAAPDEVDAHEFERLADEGRRRLQAGDPAGAATVLRTALGLWRGPALVDVAGSAAGSAGVAARASALEERRLAAVEDRIEAELLVGADGDAVAELSRLVEDHPLRERTRGLLLRALVAEGRPAEALRAYEEYRRFVADDLGADPSPELTTLHASLLRGTAVQAPPAPFTSLVGRAEDIDGVRERLRTARLVTLHGPGGVGKTRLCLEAVAEVRSVCFVALAPVSGPDELPFAILKALGLRDGALHAMPLETTPTERVVAALSDRPPLLVLDNCEHLVDAVAELVAQLLAQAKETRILATSREPLGITGEHLWPVRPLKVAEAVQLFRDRAAAVSPDVHADTATIERIGQLLDSLPLAIELAAARVRTLDLVELRDRLEDRLALPMESSGRSVRGVEPRHQTLRAAVAWSWDLLSDVERVALRRLAVFSDGASDSAAAYVCAVDNVEGVLESLVDKSLLERSRRRYRMLDTIRAFAAEQLVLAGETVAVHRAHTDFCLDLARRADRHLRRAGQEPWLDALAVEHDNLVAAMRWAVDAGEVDRALRLIASLATYLWMSGSRAAAAPAATVLLERLPDPEPPAGLENEYVLCVLTAAAVREGQAAWARHRGPAGAIVQAPDRPLPPIAIFLWSMMSSGDTELGVAPALALIPRALASADPWEVAVAHLVWGYPQLLQVDYAAAEREFTAAVDGFRTLGDRWGTALALGSLAGLADLRGDHETAVTLADEAVALTREVGAIEDLADLLCDRGDYRVRACDPAAPSVALEAAADYREAAELARRAGLPARLAAAARGLGDIARGEGDLAAARRHYEHALDLVDEHWMRGAGTRVEALIGLGRLTATAPAARALYRRAIEAATVMGTVPAGARAVTALAELALSEGDARGAATLLGAAAALRGTAAAPAGAAGAAVAQSGAVVGPDAIRCAEAAQRELGAAGFEAAYRRGARQTRRDTLRLVGVPEEVIERSPLLAT